MIPKELDFRHLTSKKGITTVGVGIDYREHAWITAGDCSLHYQGNMDLWRLDCRYDGVTDYEHDGAKLFSLPLVGVRMEFIDHGIVFLKGRIAVEPEHREDFRVPDAVLKNVQAAPGFERCRQCKPEHLMIEQYCPPANEKLWEQLRGRQVSIRTGVNWRT